VTEIRHSRNLRETANTYMLFEQARARFENARDLEAAELARLAAAFLPRDSVLLLSVRLLIATVNYQQRQLETARKQCTVILEHARRSNLGLLEGRVRLVVGLIRLQQGEPVESVREFELAEQVLARFVEPDLTITANYMLAYTLRTIGEDRRAWRAISRGLERVNDVRNLRRRQMVFYNASMLAQEADLLRGALWYQTLTLQTAESRNVAGSITEARTRRAVLLHRLSRTDAATRELAGARASLASVTDPVRAAYYDALVKATEGQILTDAKKARQNLLEAIAFFRTAEPADVPRLYLHAGRAALAAGDEVAARADFETGIDILENARLRVTGEGERISYFDESWSLFRELVQLNRRQPDLAFAFAERGRARALLDNIGTTGSLELRPTTIAARIPGDTALVQFAVLSDSLLIWVLRAGNVEFAERPVPETKLAQAITEGLARINSPDVHVFADQPLMKLHDFLIGPIRNRLGGVTRLIVVADGPLALVPFSALRDRKTGRYLVEDYTIAYSPSSNHFLTSPSTPVNRSRVLIIGNPRFDRREYAHLSDLPSAEHEALSIASLYQGATVLTGMAATRPAVVTRLPENDIIHFGGHATVNEDYPLNSALLLAANAQMPSALRIADLADLRLHSGALVVLGACSTARGASYRLEGVQSIARAFLGRGAGTVVASLWDVDDDTSAALLIRFHEEVSKGIDPATALRRAQRRLIRRIGVHQWAAFIAVGASVSIDNNR